MEVLRQVATNLLLTAGLEQCLAPVDDRRRMAGVLRFVFVVSATP